MLIGEVASKAGINPSAIRYYESIGILPKTARVSGQRHFSSDVLLHLKIVQTAKAMGFTVKELKSLMNGFSPKKAKASKTWLSLADRKIDELSELIERTQTMKSLLIQAKRCGCLNLKICSILQNHSERDMR